MTAQSASSPKRGSSLLGCGAARSSGAAAALVAQSSALWLLLSATLSRLPPVARSTARQSCNAEADCTWCKSAAVPSSCYALSDAAHLPPSIFQCDKKDASASA